MAKKRTQSLMPFDAGAWLDTPRINSLSYEQKGVWATLLCYMWQSPNKGFMLRPTGKPYTIKEIARLLGLPNTRLLDELVECGLLSLDDNGCYFDRLMVRKAEISNKRRIAGAKGGESMMARLAKTTATVVDDEPPSKSIPEPPPQADESKPPEQEETPTPKPPKKAKPKEKVKHIYAEKVMLTEKEYKTLCDEFTEPAAQRMIEILSEYKRMKGATYKEDYLAIRKWVIRAYFEEQQRNGYNNKIITNDNRGGIKDTPGCTAGTIPFEPTTGSQSGNAQESGYNERF